MSPENAARHILDCVARAKATHAGAPFWYQLRPDERGVGVVGPSDWSLYSGHGGILLTLSTLRHLVRDGAQLAELRHAFIDDMLDGLEASEWSLGAYMGIAGALYLSCRLAREWPEEAAQYRRVAAHVLDFMESRTSQRIDLNGEFDLLEGSAGAIAVTDLTIREGLVSKEAGLALIEHHLDYLLEVIQTDQTGRTGWIDPATKNVLGGLSHGFAGVALAAGRVSRNLGLEKANKIFDIAVDGQLRLFDRESRRFLDARPSDDPLIDFLTEAWCHGAEGIILAILDDPLRWRIDTAQLDEIVNLGLWGRRSGSACLCHGAAGRIAALSATDCEPQDEWGDGGRRSVRASLRESVEDLTHIFRLGEWSSGENDFSLMTGWSGVALALANPRSAAAVCVLTLDDLNAR